MSIREIADRVGVSTATVSRVLNNPEYKCAVPELRDKIWKTAIELNYTPNEAARNLKKGIKHEQKRYYISVLMTRMDGADADPFFSELLRVIESEIHGNACVLSKVWYNSLFSNDRKCKKADLTQIIQEMFEENGGRDHGLIIIGKCNVEALKILKQVYKNVVSVNRNSTNRVVDEVLCDGKKIAEIALEYLIRLGHRDIAYVGACHNEARYRGYSETLQRHGFDLIPDYVMETKHTEAEGFEAMRKFLQMEDRPTGIYCGNDITAIGMLRCLQQYKNMVYQPSIIASDDIEQSQNTKPMLTTVRLPKEEMGQFALYLLLNRIRKKHDSTVCMELEGKLVVRSSCCRVDEVWLDYCI